MMKIAIKIGLVCMIITALLLSLDFMGKSDIQKAIAQSKDNSKNTQKSKLNLKRMSEALSLLTKKPALSKKDQEAKNRIIGILSKEPPKAYLDYQIRYEEKTGVFQVGISGFDTQRAKYWATMWFKLNGVSDEGLCKLPIVFYLMPNVSRKIGPLSLQFDPRPDSCI